MNKKSVFILILFAVCFVSCKKNNVVEKFKKINVYPNNSVEYIYCKNGFERELILCLPENFYSAEKITVPLVMVLHGYGNTALGFMHEIGFDEAACAEGYAVCYVSGKCNPQSFNRRSCWSYGEDEWSKKDIQNLADLAQFLQNQFGFSAEKTAAVGFSNGAIMVNKLAVEKSDTFHAVVSVSGMMSSNVWNKAVKTDPEKISSYFQINGTADELVPLRISKKSTYNPMPPFEEEVLEYISKIRIDDAKKKSLSERTVLYKFNNKVWWALIDGETHEWPGERWSGIDVSSLIIEFLNKNFN